MNRLIRYIKFSLLILVLAGVLVAGLLLIGQLVNQPVRQAVRPQDPETIISPIVQQAGRSYYDTLHPDGTMTRSFTLGTGAYLADHGEYKPIDATISKTTGEYQYENTTNVFQTHFKDNGQADQLVSYNLAGTSAKFAFVGGKDSVALAKDNTITYPGVLDGIDAKYTITGDKLLEELITDESPKTDTITQKLYLSGVYYKKEQDGSVTFHDEKTKNTVFTIPRPVMYEQSSPDKMNFGLHYEIVNEDDHFLISKVIDQEGKNWLTTAQYPVVIDFTLTYSSTSSLEGMVLCQTNGGSICGATDRLFGYGTASSRQIGKYATSVVDRSLYRTYLSFDTSPLNGVTEIDAAHIRLYGYGTGFQTGDVMRVYSGTNKWTASSFASPTLSFFNVSDTMQIEQLVNVSGWNASGCTVPGDCEHSVSILPSSLNLTGQTQFVFTDHDIHMPAPPHGSALMDVFMTGNLNPALRPVLDVDLPFPPPSVAVEITPSYPANDLEILLSDYSTIENYWVLERSEDNINWSVICDHIWTGQYEEPAVCNSQIFYHCQDTSEPTYWPDGGGQCNIFDFSVQNSFNTNYYYRAYAVDTDRSVRSENSNVDFAYTGASSVEESISPVTSPRWNAAGEADSSFPYNLNNPNYPDPGGTNYCLGVKVPNGAGVDGYFAQLWRGTMYGASASADATCRKPAVWPSLVYVTDYAWPYYPNQKWSLASVSRNEDGAMTTTADAYYSSVYSRARRPSQPVVTNGAANNTLHVAVNTASSDNGNLGTVTVCGDVNNNGSLDPDPINGSDVTYLVNYFNGGSPPPNMANADINGDGSVDPLDSSALVDYLKGVGGSNCGHAGDYTNPTWTDYAMRVSWGSTTRYVNPLNRTGGGLQTSQVWCDYSRGTDCPGSGCLEGTNNSCTWNSVTGFDITGLGYNTCYDFSAESRNEDNVVGSESKWCLRSNGAKLGFCNTIADCPSGTVSCASYQDYASNPFSGATSECTLAAKPTLTINECNYNSDNGYFCRTTLGANGNPATTEYRYEMAVDGYYQTVKTCSTSTKVGTEDIYYSCTKDSDCPDKGECRDANAHKDGDIVSLRSLACTADEVKLQVVPINIRRGTDGPRSDEVTDTLPPCAITDLAHSDNPYSPLQLVWAWQSPVSALPIAYLDVFDSSANLCLAGEEDGFCPNKPSGKSLLPDDKGYQQTSYFDKGAEVKLNPNTRYGVYIRAIDYYPKLKIYRAGAPSNIAPAYTAIEPVTNITFSSVTTSAMTVWAEPRVFTNVRLGNTGFNFQKIVNPGDSLPTELGFGSSFTQNIFATDNGLSANRRYCYQGRSRNADGQTTPGDINGWLPVGGSCKYTLARQPYAPRLLKQESSDNILMIVRPDDGNPHGLSYENNTQYAACVTHYDPATEQPDYSYYIAPDTGLLGSCSGGAVCTGQESKSVCEGYGGCSWTWNTACNISNPTDNPGSSYWAARVDATPSWGGDVGVEIKGLDNSKYDFRLKARNGESVVTDFGPAATLFVVKNNVVGWAWTSNAGWVSLNCLNLWTNPTQYGYSCGRGQEWGLNVRYEEGRDINPLEGYAWSGSGQALQAGWRASQVPSGGNIGALHASGMAAVNSDIWVVISQSTTEGLRRIRANDGKELNCDGTEPTGAPSRCAGFGDDLRGVVYANNYLWVTSRNENRIYQINPSDGAQVSSITLADCGSGCRPTGITTDGTDLWVSLAVASGRVARVRLSNLTELTCNGSSTLASNNDRCSVGSTPSWPTFDGNYIWVPNTGGSTISRIDRYSGVVTSYSSGNAPYRAVFDQKYLWITRQNDAAGTGIAIIDTSGVAIGTITHAGGADPYDWRNDVLTDIVYTGGYIWVNDATDNKVFQIDPALRTVTNVYDTGAGSLPQQSLVNTTDIWVSLDNANTLTKIGHSNDAVKTGLGWISFFRGVCSNNRQMPCDPDPGNNTCGVGTCMVSAGDPTDGSPTYGYCYNNDATPHRYGVCSNNSNNTCTEASIDNCEGVCSLLNSRSCTRNADCQPTYGSCEKTAYCRLVTCKSGDTYCSNECRTWTTASINGITREVDGWGRIISLQEEGIRQGNYDDWGWIKLNGTYNGGAGPYKLTGTEVDSQQFFGSPDVNTLNVKLYSLFGWAWQGKGTENINTGWFEFMPVGALLGIPWVKTAYSDIYAGSTIQLAPPPRGSGNYTSTFLILSNGDIQGIQGYYGQMQSGTPTSAYNQSGFNSLITGAGQPLGTQPLKKIDIETLTRKVSDCFIGSAPVSCSNPSADRGKNKYGQEVIDDTQGGDDVDLLHTGSKLSGQTVLNGKIYYFHGANNYVLSAEDLTFMKGSGSTTGNGLIIIDGDVEINKNVYYEKRCTDAGGDQLLTDICHADSACRSESTHTSCKTRNLGTVSEMPSAAIIVRGDMDVSSFVTELSGALIVVPRADDTGGSIDTGRKRPISLQNTNGRDDGYIIYDQSGDTYKENFDEVVELAGRRQTETYRTFMRWSLDIPAGAEIKRAYLRVRDDGTRNDDATFAPRIYLVDSGNMDSPDSYGNPDYRELYNIDTNNSVSAPIANWNAAAGWNYGDQNISPDISSLVQRFVNRDDYQKGNYLGLAIKEGNAMSLPGDNYLSFASNESNPPELVIEYAPRRTVYSPAANSDDIVAWQGNQADDDPLRVGWNGTRAERSVLRLAVASGYTPVPVGAEILKARLKVTERDSTGNFQIRQGLLSPRCSNDQSRSCLANNECAPGVCNFDFASIPVVDAFDLPPDRSVSELAQPLVDKWYTGEIFKFLDIKLLIQAWADKSYYLPNDHLGLMLRRGENEMTDPGSLLNRRFAGNTDPQMEIDYQAPLYVNGLLIAKGFSFDRKYTKNLAPSEQIVYDGRVVANTPPGLADFVRALPVYQQVTP